MLRDLNIDNGRPRTLSIHKTIRTLIFIICLVLFSTSDFIQVIHIDHRLTLDLFNLVLIALGIYLLRHLLISILRLVTSSGSTACLIWSGLLRIIIVDQHLMQSSRWLLITLFLYHFWGRYLSWRFDWP